MRYVPLVLAIAAVPIAVQAGDNGASSPAARPAATQVQFLAPPVAARSDAAARIARLPSPPATAGAPTAVAANESLTAGPLSLADVEQMALGGNPTLAQAAARVRALRGEWVQVGLYPNPKVAYTADEIGAGGKQGFQGGKVSQEFVTAHKLRINRAVVSQEIAKAEQLHAAQELRVRNDARLRFYDVLIAQRSVELAEQLQRIGAEGAKTTAALHDAMEVGRVDVLQSRIESSTTGIQLEKARHAERAAWLRLTAVLGAPELAPTRLIGRIEDAIPDLSWEGAISRLLDESPEMSAALSEVERARWAVRQAAAERRPNVELEGGVQQDTENREVVTNVMLSVPLPIFNRNQGNIIKAQAELAAAQRDVDRVALDLQQRLANVFERYAASQELVQRYHDEILPAAREALEIVNRGYKQGELDYLAVLTAQRTYFQATMTWLEALRDARSAAIEIDGLLLTDSLQGTK